MPKNKYSPFINPAAVLIIAILLAFILWSFWFSIGIYLIQNDITHHANKLINTQSPTASNVPDSIDILFTRLGQSGDAFGGFNAIISALACAGVFFAAYLQHETLKETQKALKDQETTQAKERFENTFFSLSNSLNSSLFYICEPRIDPNKIGNHLSKSIVDIIKCELFGEHNRRSPHYDLFHAKVALLQHNPFLNQYFRGLYQILKFIATNAPNSNLEGDFSVENLRKTNASPEEKNYSNIIRSFIPENVYYLLAINCCSTKDNDQYMSYRLLIERYEFLEHMPLNLSINENQRLINNLVKHYDKCVWGDNEDLPYILSTINSAN